MQLENKMQKLKEHFQLKEDDLKIRLNVAGQLD
ncbi:MAG: hypothetical protein HC880_12005 [Bacteroidia bacterium]|nr:hypothetical protein [Bacteroidia bacterium]